MDTFWNWLRTILYVSLFLAVVMHLIPEKKYRKYIRFFAGMMILVLTVGPLANLFSQHDSLENLIQEKLFRQESVKTSADLETMEESSREYYEDRITGEASQLIEEKVSEEGLETADSRIELSENGTISRITVSVKEKQEGGSGTEKNPDEITAVEAVRIRLSGDGNKEENKKTSAKAGRLRTELSGLFDIPQDCVEILEE